MIRLRSTLAVFSLGLALVACDKDKAQSTTTTGASTNAPATAATPAAPATDVAPAAKPAGETAKATAETPKKLPDAKRHAIPGDWQRLADTQKGFAFHLPKGAKLESVTKHGVDMHMAELDKPHHVAVLVTVYKDASKSLVDLEKDATHLLEALDHKDVKVEKTETVSSDYTLLTMTSHDDKKKAWKFKALLATDVTDNYLFFVGTPESEFKADEATMDEIVGGFEMWSGGASGTAH